MERFSPIKQTYKTIRIAKDQGNHSCICGSLRKCSGGPEVRCILNSNCGDSCHLSVANRVFYRRKSTNSPMGMIRV